MQAPPQSPQNRRPPSCAVTLLSHTPRQNKEGAASIRQMTCAKANAAGRTHMENVLQPILSRYESYCQAHNISFSVHLETGLFSFMTDADLTVLFLNLLDNAARSASEYAKEGGKDPFIRLAAARHPCRSQVSLILQNSCPVSSRQRKKGGVPPFRRPAPGRGAGLACIREVAAAYRGSLKIYAERKAPVFYTVVTLRAQSSIRP